MSGNNIPYFLNVSVLCVCHHSSARHATTGGSNVFLPKRLVTGGVGSLAEKIAGVSAAVRNSIFYIYTKYILGRVLHSFIGFQILSMFLKVRV